MDINLTDVWTDVNCKAIILVKNLIHAVFSKQRQTVCHWWTQQKLLGNTSLYFSQELLSELLGQLTENLS